MRRTVWVVVVGLLALAVVAQSVTMVEQRKRDEFFDDGETRTVHVRTWPPRIVVTPGKVRSESTSGRRSNSKPTNDDRDDIVWASIVESSPKVKADAYNDALDKARNQLTHDFWLSHPPSREFVNKYVRVNHEEIQGPSDSLIGNTYIVKMDLQLTRDVWRQLAQDERRTRVQDRMGGLARVIGIATVLLGCIACYIRFDEWTKGYYTGRLRVAMILLAGLATAGIAHIRI